MFHSLYSQNCKEARQQFSSLSERYYGVDHVGLGAVDCHRQPEQGRKFSFSSLTLFYLDYYYTVFFFFSS